MTFPHSILCLAECTVLSHASSKRDAALAALVAGFWMCSASLPPHHIKHGAQDLLAPGARIALVMESRTGFLFLLFLFLVLVSGVDTGEVLFLLFAFAPTRGTHCSLQCSAWCSTNDQC